MDDIKERLTKKLGPLPVWAWALIIVGVGYVGFKFLTRNSGAVTDTNPYATDSASEDGLSDYLTNSAGSIGSPGLSSGGGGVALTPPTNPYDSSAIGMASSWWTYDNPLPVRLQQVEPNLYDGTGYAPVQTQQQAPASNPLDGLIAAAQAALNAAKDAERGRQAELSAAKDAERAAQAEVQRLKNGAGQPGQIAAAQAAKNAAAARSGTAQALKDQAAAASGVAQAQLDQLLARR